MSVCVLCACSSSSSSSIPSSGQSGKVRVRFLDGAPHLEVLQGSTLQGICPGPSAPCYLQVNGQTVSQNFSYGTVTPFLSLNAGPLSLVARDTLGYAVGPLKSTALTPGKTYTLIVIGAYPNYSVLTFDEPPSGSNAQLSLYEASPSLPNAAFGSFGAASSSNFKQLGTAALGSVATVTLGKHVSNIGAFVGPASKPIGTITPSSVNAFDKKNELPFRNATRLSVFLFDSESASGSSALFGSLDR